MPIVNNFLCFDLPTGGYTIGFFGLFISTFLIAFAGYNMMHVNDMILFTVSGAEIVIFTIYLITSITLIIGTKKRNTKVVFPSLISSFLVIISVVMNLVLLNWQYIPFGIYLIYSLICILSLCQLFRDEDVRQSVRGYQPTRTAEV
ncbi:uncharacterized protein [Chironomus tepperi]|uniref:uncharacterized protein n=1 Tax=Chironomus tepperi TaxID=113505 RepID=UPI00391F478C